MNIKIKFFNQKAVPPKKAHHTDAGFDLTVTEIKKKSLFKIHYKFGFGVEFPEGMYAEVYSRSSIHKKWLWLSNSVGIIDNGYTGEWQAVFYKIPFISKPYKVGDRACQAIFKFMQDAYTPIGFHSVNNLDNTERGEGGLGSTGGY